MLRSRNMSARSLGRRRGFELGTRVASQDRQPVVDVAHAGAVGIGLVLVVADDPTARRRRRCSRPTGRRCGRRSSAPRRRTRSKRRATAAEVDREGTSRRRGRRTSSSSAPSSTASRIAPPVPSRCVALVDEAHRAPQVVAGAERVADHVAEVADRVHDVGDALRTRASGAGGPRTARPRRAAAASGTCRSPAHPRAHAAAEHEALSHVGHGNGLMTRAKRRTKWSIADGREQRQWNFGRRAVAHRRRLRTSPRAMNDREEDQERIDRDPAPSRDDSTEHGEWHQQPER